MTGDDRRRRSRRRLLRSLGAGLTALAATNAGAAQEGDAAVLFTDQTTDGAAIRIAAVRTAIDVTYTVRSLDTDRILAQGTFNAGTRRRGVTIRLDELLERDQTLSISLSRPNGGATLTSDSAEVSVLGDTNGNATDGRGLNGTATDETAGDNATADEVVEVDERDGAESDVDGQGALSGGETDPNGRDADSTEADREEQSSSELSGFGIGTALASFGGVAYALDRRRDGDE